MALPFRLKIGEALWNILISYLFLEEAEDAHKDTIKLLKWIENRRFLWALHWFYESPYWNMPVNVGGSIWRSPVCIGAGFDKQAEIMEALSVLAGAVEIGTVTPLPQFGNDRPRVFRYTDQFAVINRYGFNSVGINAVCKSIFNFRHECGYDFPLGISIGKNKETPEDKAVDDYIECFQKLLPILGSNDWIKINISSPNTPELRNIFLSLDEFLGEFRSRAERIVKTGGLPMPPLFLKVPPDDLTEGEYNKVVRLCKKYGFSAIEATNTSMDEELKQKYGLSETGGLSGEPLRKRSTEVLRMLAPAAKEAGIDLIGVGGIGQGKHALEKREAGAKAVQVYTGLIFRGPILIHEILESWLGYKKEP